MKVLDAGVETLGEYVTGVWAATHAPTLAPKTRLHYASLYDHHLRPYLGAVALRDITPELIGRWQSDRLAAGAGPVAVRHAMDLLGSILEHAFVGGRLSENPARRVKKARRPRREEVRPLSPAQVEAMRAVLPMRDATLISVLAYAGLRPGEAPSSSRGLFPESQGSASRCVGGAGVQQRPCAPDGGFGLDQRHLFELVDDVPVPRERQAGVVPELAGDVDDASALVQ